MRAADSVASNRGARLSRHTKRSTHTYLTGRDCSAPPPHKCLEVTFIELQHLVAGADDLGVLLELGLACREVVQQVDLELLGLGLVILIQVVIRLHGTLGAGVPPHGALQLAWTDARSGVLVEAAGTGSMLANRTVLEALVPHGLDPLRELELLCLLELPGLILALKR